MESLDDVLNGTNDDASNHVEPVENRVEFPAGETHQADAAAVEGQAGEGSAVDAGANAEGEGAPPAQEHGKNVPLKALEAERAQRQDWKEQAIRFQEQAKAAQAEIERMRQQPQQPAAQQQEPMTVEHALMSQRLDMSEMFARQKHEDLDDVIEVYRKAAEAGAAPRIPVTEKHPYEWAYAQGKKLQALAEIGDDPSAYQEKIREQIRAELAAQQPVADAEPAPAAAPLNLPKSLATSRSAAPRNTVPWTGPTPLTNIAKLG